MKTIQLRALTVTLMTVLSVSFLTAQLQRDLMYWRPSDERGVNMFEDPKVDTTVYDGIRVRVGGAFTQQFQALSHSNESTPENAFLDLSNGFNLATANLHIGAQLADGVRLDLVTYLSSRHHPEAWVKGGYIQFDKLAFLNSEFLDNIMEVVTIRIGHMEINYGDEHFRRTDNGNALYNAFVGNYIMDAFTTEIGAEIYYKKNNIIAMFGITGGEIKGDVTAPPPDSGTGDEGHRAPSILGKVGWDNGANGTYSGNVRFRITGSVYYTASSRSNTLYGGDRAGSRYYLVTELPGATTDGNAFSGRYNPGFRDQVTSFMINPFVKFGGLEFFGTFETSSGRSSSEVDTRNAMQIAGELIYRFGKMENVYVGGRYNTVSAEDGNAVEDKIHIDRYAFTAGWFVTKNLLLKAEYVNQDYKDFVEASRFYNANFNGVMIEAVVGF